MCCGYPDKLDAINYPKAPLDSYKKISKQLDSSILDAISIEDAHRYNDEEIFEDFKNKKLILGLIKIASSKEETEQEIEQRIKAVLRYIDKERLIAAPDCGLGFLPKRTSYKKIKPQWLMLLGNLFKDDRSHFRKSLILKYELCIALLNNDITFY